jgi:hypothetical protein
VCGGLSRHRSFREPRHHCQADNLDIQLIDEDIEGNDTITIFSVGVDQLTHDFKSCLFPVRVSGRSQAKAAGCIFPGDFQRAAT